MKKKNPMNNLTVEQITSYEYYQQFIAGLLAKDVDKYMRDKRLTDTERCKYIKQATNAYKRLLSYELYRQMNKQSGAMRNGEFLQA